MTRRRGSFLRTDKSADPCAEARFITGDVELVYNKERDELWLYYVEADDIVQSWVKLMRSADRRSLDEAGDRALRPGAEITTPVALHPAYAGWKLADVGMLIPGGIQGIRTRTIRFAPAPRRTYLHWSEEETLSGTRAARLSALASDDWRDPADDLRSARKLRLLQSCFTRSGETSQPWKVFPNR